MVCNLKYNLEKHTSAASINNNKDTNSNFFQKFLKNKTEIMTSDDTMLACLLMDIIHLIHFSI